MIFQFQKMYQMPELLSPNMTLALLMQRLGQVLVICSASNLPSSRKIISQVSYLPFSLTQFYLFGTNKVELSNIK